MVCDRIRKSFSCCVKKRQYLLSCDSGDDGLFDKCTVHLLDGLDVTISVPKLALGRDALVAVLRQLDLSESDDYFALQYMAPKGDFHWLDPDKQIQRQLKLTEGPFPLYFRVKFYISEPHLLNEELTRYHIFLQVKSDVIASRLQPPPRQCIDMCAYAVQSELGDFDASIHKGRYVSEFNFLKYQTDEIENAIAKKHRSLAGLTPAECEMRYLKMACGVAGYGVDERAAVGEDGKACTLQLSPSGVSTRRSQEKAIHHAWDTIVDISFKKKRFTLRVKNDYGGPTKEYKFQLPSNHHSKSLWKDTIDHHRFHQSENRNRSKEPRSNSVSFQRSRSGRQTQRSTMGYIRVGSSVWARVLSGDYYKGVVTVISNKVYVKLSEGDTVAHERNDSVNIIYDMPPNADELEVGTNVIAHWSGVPAYLPGVITKIEGERYHVLYDDHDRAVKKIEQIRVLKPPRYFGPGSGRTKIQKKFSMKTTSLSGRSDVSLTTNNTSSFKEPKTEQKNTRIRSNQNKSPIKENHNGNHRLNQENGVLHLNRSRESTDSYSESKDSLPDSRSSRDSRSSPSDHESSDSLLSSDQSRESVNAAEKLSKNFPIPRALETRRSLSPKEPSKLSSSKSFSYSTTRSGLSEKPVENRRLSPLPQTKYSHLIAGRNNVSDRFNDLSRLSREKMQVYESSELYSKGLNGSDIPLIHRTMSNIEDSRRHRITEL